MQESKGKWFFNNFENILGSICTVIMIVLLIMQVLFRYIFGSSIPWTEEQAIIFFILSIYFGAAGAIKRNQHLKIDLLVNFFSPKNRIKLNILADACFSCFNVVIIYSLIQVTANLKKYNMVTPVTQVSKWIYYAFLPVLFVLMIIRLIQEIKDKLILLKEIE